MPAFTQCNCASVSDAIRLAAALDGSAGADVIFVNGASVELIWRTTSPPLPAAAIAAAKTAAALDPPQPGFSPVRVVHTAAGVVTKA